MFTLSHMHAGHSCWQAEMLVVWSRYGVSALNSQFKLLTMLSSCFRDSLYCYTIRFLPLSPFFLSASCLPHAHPFCLQIAYQFLVNLRGNVTYCIWHSLFSSSLVLISLLAKNGKCCSGLHLSKVSWKGERKCFKWTITCHSIGWFPFMQSPTHTH